MIFGKKEVKMIKPKFEMGQGVAFGVDFYSVQHKILMKGNLVGRIIGVKFYHTGDELPHSVFYYYTISHAGKEFGKIKEDDILELKE